MKKVIFTSLLSLAFLAPSQAEAAWGFTAHQGVDIAAKQQQYMSPMEYLPTIDYKAGKVLIQFDALETIASLGREDLMNFGLNGYYTVSKGEINSNFDGVLQMGASIDLQQDNTIEDAEHNNIYALAQARMGAQSAKKFGIGIYVVPGIGIANVPALEQDGDEYEMETELAVGTGLQISVWTK